MSDQRLLQTAAALQQLGIKIASLSQFLLAVDKPGPHPHHYSNLEFDNFLYHMSICTKIYQHENLTLESFVTPDILKLW